MPRDPRKYLHDMLDSCRFVIEFTTGRSCEDFASDRAFRSAIERELQIVGEALYQLDRVHPDIAARIRDHRRIIDFRHVLVHGYATVRARTVWAVVTDRLPRLEQELVDLLGS